MTVLIDPARWPAHGTVFSHLVSDESLEELHAFARATGVPANAFDGDDYDVPVNMYEALVLAGAVDGSASELLTRLLKAGLRITAAERTTAPEKILHWRFARMFPNTAGLDRDPIC